MNSLSSMYTLQMEHWKPNKKKINQSTTIPFNKWSIYDLIPAALSFKNLGKLSVSKREDDYYGCFTEKQRQS